MEVKDKFVRLFEHKPPKHRIKNTNLEHDEQLTTGQRVSDTFATVMGSWRFIIIQSIILVFWIVLNTIAFFVHWDSYPYILLNLALSFQAAFATPVILMSQNRQASKDRLTADHDYQINLKGEEETRQLIQHLYEQDAKILDIASKLDSNDNEMIKQTEMLHNVIQNTKRRYT